MPIRKLNPTSPGTRFRTISGFDEVTKKTPEKGLLVSVSRNGGRNNTGRITQKHRGGGHRKLVRRVDFKRNKDGVEGRVIGVEYDPGRSANVALVHYIDGDKRYIIAPQGLTDGAVVNSGRQAEIKAGNTLELKDIPLGALIHNIEMRPGKGAQVVRSAGTFAQLMAKEGRYATLKLPSGETRLFLQTCRATLGAVGNADHENVSLGKAGRSRWKGWRPRVRAVAKNPVDHPMGGGEGRTSGGRHPCTPWGKPTKGYKTRHVKKASERLIISRRKKK